jgi:hypothetical protein
MHGEGIEPTNDCNPERFLRAGCFSRSHWHVKQARLVSEVCLDLNTEVPADPAALQPDF